MLTLNMGKKLKDSLNGTFNVRIGESAVGNHENVDFVSLKCKHHGQLQSNSDRQLCTRLCGQVPREFGGQPDWGSVSFLC
jgi:hypothetical protein